MRSPRARGSRLQSSRAAEAAGAAWEARLSTTSPTTRRGVTTGMPKLVGTRQVGSTWQRAERDTMAADFTPAEATKLAERGKAAVRENPLRSLRWEDPEEERQVAAGYWMD